MKQNIFIRNSFSHRLDNRLIFRVLIKIVGRLLTVNITCENFVEPVSSSCPCRHPFPWRYIHPSIAENEGTKGNPKIRPTSYNLYGIKLYFDLRIGYEIPDFFIGHFIGYFFWNSTRWSTLQMTQFVTHKK